MADRGKATDLQRRNKAILKQVSRDVVPYPRGQHGSTFRSELVNELTQAPMRDRCCVRDGVIQRPVAPHTTTQSTPRMVQVNSSHSKGHEATRCSMSSSTISATPCRTVGRGRAAGGWRLARQMATRPCAPAGHSCSELPALSADGRGKRETSVDDDDDVQSSEATTQKSRQEPHRYSGRAQIPISAQRARKTGQLVPPDGQTG